MRTVMLVMLTATVAMLQVNLLLPMTGKAPNLFNVLDLMRLPLGYSAGSVSSALVPLSRKRTEP